MQYYKVQNEIISPTTARQPAWLFSCGVDFWKIVTSPDMKICIIVSENPIPIEPADRPDIHKISEQAAQVLENNYHPPYEVDDEYVDEETGETKKRKRTINPAQIKSFGKGWGKLKKRIDNLRKKGCFQLDEDHSGAINTETWTLANSPHHLTGSVTVNNGETLTIEAGCEIYFDAYYRFIVYGAIVANGTSSARISFDTNLIAAYSKSWIDINFSSADAGISFTYCDIINSKEALYFTSTTLGGMPTINHLYIDNCYKGILNQNTSSITLTIEYSKVKCTALSCNESMIFNYCRFEEVTLCSKTTYNYCLFQNCILLFSGSVTTNFNYCVSLFARGSYHNFRFATGIGNMSNCIIYGNEYYGIRYVSSADGLIENCDILRNNRYGVYQGGGLENCYLAGNGDTGTYFTDEDNADTTANAGTDDGTMNTDSTETPKQFEDVDYVRDMRATPNFPKTLSGEASTPGDTSCVITFTSGRRGTGYIKYGKTPGNLHMRADEDLTWSGYNGGDTVVTSHSITVPDLDSNTKYYYRCYNKDGLDEEAESGSELNFTTTGTKTHCIDINIITDSGDYYNGDAVTLTGNIKLDTATTGTAVKVEIRKKSDNSLVATPMNTTYNFVANTSATINTINGGALTWTSNIAIELYAQATISGGAPTIDTTITESDAITYFVVENSYPIINDINIEGDEITYQATEVAAITGNVKIDRNVANATVKVEVRKKVDDSLVSTLMSKTISFTANVSQTITAMNGAALTYACTTVGEYYFKIIISGGTPTINNSYTEDSAINSFEIREDVSAKFPVSVSVASDEVNVIVE